MNQVPLLTQRLVSPAGVLAAPGCSLLVFPPLASARSEFALAMSHGSQWPQGQLCGQDSLFLALALALTGHPSWKSPLPRS